MLKRTALLLCGMVIVQALCAAPLTSLISRADAIVVGTESAPIQVGTTVSFYLNVERVFTGNLQVGSTVNVVWNTRTNVGLPDGSPSFRGIWFLRMGADGNWQCIPAGSTGNAEFFPDLSLPAAERPLPPQLAYDANTTDLADRIILEMAGGSPRPNPRMILGVIPNANSLGTLRAFRYLAASQSEELSVVGLTGLIEAGETEGILSTEAALVRLNTGVTGSDLVASAIKLHFRNSDPVAVASLGRMATSGNSSSLIQSAAAQALVAIHSVAAVPWLGSLLNASSTEMQTYGAQGLSYFVNGVGIPTSQNMPSLSHLNQRQPSLYRTPDTDQHIGYPTGQSASFIQFWKNWWEQHPELHAVP